MARLLKTWRSWSVRRRLLVAGGAGAVVIVAVAVTALLVLKRPADVSNPNAAFHEQPKPPVKTVDWPMYGRDPERTRYLPAKHLDPPLGNSLWSFQAGKLLEFQPIVVGHRIYFMDKDGMFYALSTSNGHIVWKRKIGNLNASSPAYSKGMLYAVNL